MDVDTEHASKVAALNDAFRKSGVRTMVTPGVREFEDMGALVGAVRSFGTFTEDNDPYGETSYKSVNSRSVLTKENCKMCVNMLEYVACHTTIWRFSAP